MDAALLTDLLFTTLRAGTPLMLCVLGVLLAERSGVLNLGQEGMMLMGAVIGFATAFETGSGALGAVAGAMSGLLMGLFFALLTLGLHANAVATGLALAIFGSGMSAFVGSSYIGESLQGLPTITIPGVSALPILGKALFAQDAMLYCAWLLAFVVGLILHRSRWGLVLTAVGEAPEIAHRLGHRVILIRSCAAGVGGALAGLGGAYLSLAYTPLWSEGMTSGRGWIALAMVVLAGWRTGMLVIAAYLFGLVSILNLLLQDAGWAVSANLLAMLPYLFCLLALVLLSRQSRYSDRHAPSALGRPFNAET